MWRDLSDLMQFANSSARSVKSALNESNPNMYEWTGCFENAAKTYLQISVLYIDDKKHSAPLTVALRTYDGMFITDVV